jgi:lipoprotein-releasing system permease protein
MNTLSAYLAWRFLWFKGKDKNISFMIKICFLSIFIGTFSLMLTLIIMNGFEKVIHEKMQGINAHVIICSPGNRLDYDDLRKVLKQEFAPLVHQVSGNSIKQVILDHNNLRSILFIKGVDVDREEDVSTVATKIIRPMNMQLKYPILPSLLKDNHIFIGYKTATEHHLTVGDTLTILIPEPGGTKKIFLTKQTVTIAGIFRIGLDEYDSNFAFASLDYLNDVFDERGVDNITIRLTPYAPSALTTFTSWRNALSLSWWQQTVHAIGHRIKQFFMPLDYEKAVIKLLKQRLPHLEINSWKDLYPDLVSSLILEKYVMFFILALITLVATLNMISLLFMQIQHKLRDIAIMKTIGLANKPIRSIFLALGVTITLLASLSGLGCAAVAGYLLERYPFIKLPDVYYVSYLPARMDFELFVVVFCATLLLGFLATWIPAQRTKRINIAHVLRQE